MSRALPSTVRKNDNENRLEKKRGFAGDISTVGKVRILSPAPNEELYVSVKIPFVLR